MTVVRLETGADLRLGNEQAPAAAVFVNGGTARVVPGTWSATSELLANELAPRFPELAFGELRYRLKTWHALDSCMPIQATRRLLHAALSGELDDVEYRTDPVFGFSVPVSVPGVEPSLLDPRSTWRDRDAYDAKGKELAAMFASNFETRFAAEAGEAVAAAGPLG